MCKNIPGNQPEEAEKFVYLRIPLELFENAHNYLSIIDACIHGVLYTYRAPDLINTEKLGMKWDPGWAYDGLEEQWYEFRSKYYELLLESSVEISPHKPLHGVIVAFENMKEKYKAALVSLMKRCELGKVPSDVLDEFVKQMETFGI